MRSREIINDEPLPAADDLWWTGLTTQERIDADPARYFQEGWSLSYVEAARQIQEENAIQAQIRAEHQPKTEKWPKHAGVRGFGSGVMGLLRNVVHTPQHRIERDV